MSKTTARAISHPDRLRNFERNSRQLSSAQPAVMKAFWKFHAAAVAPAALDTKTKELIALAISVAARCDDCIAHHTYDALEAGASKEEIADALGVAILMSGGTGVVYATHAIEALDQFSERAR
jgi:AhpD family alkylhydroperoxidase